MSDNPHIAYANAQLRHKKQKSQGFHHDAKHAEREMIRISNLHKIKTGKHINDHAEKLVAHHEKAKEIKRQYVQHSTDLIHAKKAGDKERMERAAKGKAQAEKDHLAHTGEPAEEKFVEYKRPVKEEKEMRTFKQIREACWKGYEKVGMKKKGDKVVPNCVPEEVENLEESEHAVARLADKLETHYYNGHQMGGSRADKESAIQKVKHHISKAPTEHLKALHKTNMGWETHRAGRQQGLTHPVVKHITSELKNRGVMQEEAEQIDEAAPHGMSDKEYARHELGKAKKPEVKVGAKVSVTGGGSGVVQKIYDKELHNGQKRKFIHLKDNQGRDFHHRYYAHRVKVMEEVEQTDEQAPVAPTLDRKYLKGTPEHKAYKASKVRQKFRLVYKDGKLSVKEDVEQTDEGVLDFLKPKAGRRISHLDSKPREGGYPSVKRSIRGWTSKNSKGQARSFAPHEKELAKKYTQEETDRNQRLRDALAKVKNDFTKPPADHKDAEPSKPASAPKPKTSGGMPYYPDSHGGKRYMGDSVEMDGEQIDELSKDTLASYNRKAWDDRQANQHKTAELSKKPLLYRGKTYTKDERDDAEKTHNELRKLAHRHGTRTKGIETSEKKWMAKEEVEQIDELSKDTLRAYAKKAVPDMNDSNEKSQQHHAKSQQALDSGNEKLATKHHNLAKKFKDRTEKRMAGVFGAIRRAKANEEVEQLEEAKHRVNVTVSDPNHSAVSKRNETVQKFVRLSAADEKSAVEKAKAHYKGKGYRVHSAEHAGMVNESAQLDEISAKTLTSYIDKASHDHSKHRGKNILRARRKLLKKPLPPIHPDHHKA